MTRAFPSWRGWSLRWRKREAASSPAGEAFRLYDTYGFPVDLTREILEEKGFSIDEEGFEKAARAQKERAKGTFGETNYMGADVTVYESIDPSVTSTFVGYDHLTYDSEITVLTTEDEVVDALSDGEKGTVFVKETPFYATSGGQEADNGVIRTEDGLFQVEDTIKLLGGKIGHVGHVVRGHAEGGRQGRPGGRPGEACPLRKEPQRDTSSPAGLRQVLGTHVEQAGSSVNEYRLRFDFTHFSAMTKEELKRVEAIVNEQIMNCLPVKAENMPIEEARKTGAAALFGEKYGDIVRVVSMGDFSKEFCGGTHVDNTGVITAFKIISETGVAAGVRRIEALTSKGLLRYYDELEERLEKSAKLLKTTPDKLEERLSHMLAENKELHSEVEGLKSRLAKESMGDVTDQVTEVKGIKFLAAKAPALT